MAHDVTLIPGDGIGPEITAATLKVLDATGVGFQWDRQQGGTAALVATGDPLPPATLDSIRRTRLALKGPLTTPVGGGYRSVNVALRKEFELFANVRPARTIVPGGRYDGIDIVLVRENLEGLYVGQERWVERDGDPRGQAESVAVVTRSGSDRVIRYAFDYALRHGRKLVTLVHKANILKHTSGLFLEVGREIAREFSVRVAMNELIIDNCAMQL
ncbi:MAG: isocitrate/isopropylmalate family dehydrogenase, partial [Gemmatimonadales bacterium]